MQKREEVYWAARGGYRSHSLGRLVQLSPPPCYQEEVTLCTRDDLLTSILFSVIPAKLGLTLFTRLDEVYLTCVLPVL